MNAMRILFHRDFKEYTGGHGKVWDYFNHAIALGLDARVYLTPDSLRDASNPWLSMPQRIESAWQPEKADLLFLAGMDWAELGAFDTLDIPVINLVQHVRHADPALPLRRFLSRQAWRICVSRAVAKAIVATGEVVGAVRVIPAALNLPAIEAACTGARHGVFIGAFKNPVLGQSLHELLKRQGQPCRLSTNWLPRRDFLEALASARTAVLLPHATEGFFLPGLEAMALDCAVVMPDCTGNSEYAVDGFNCLMPAPTAPSLSVAVARLQDHGLHDSVRTAGVQTAARHTLLGEREAFASVLAEMRP